MPERKGVLRKWSRSTGGRGGIRKTYGESAKIHLDDWQYPGG